MKYFFSIFLLFVLLSSMAYAYELPSERVFKAGDRIYSIAADGKGILLGSKDGYAYYISKDGKLLWKYGVGSEIYAAYLTSDYAFLGARDDFLYILTRGGSDVRKIDLQGDVTGIKVLGSTIYASMGYQDNNGNFWGKLYAWTVNGKFLWQVKLEGAGLSVDSDGKLVVIGTGWQKNGYHGTIEAYDTKGNLKFSYKANDWVKTVRMCSGLILGASYDGNLYALSADGKLLWKYNAVNPIYSMDCDGKIIALGTNDGTVHILDMQGRVLMKDSIGKAPWALKIDGQYIYIGTDSGELLKLDRASAPSDEIAKAENLLNTLESASGVTLSPVRDLLNQAKERFSSGYYEAAYDYATQAYAKAEEAKDAWGMIKRAQSAGDVSEAVKAFEAGDYEKAKQIAERILNIKPSSTSSATAVTTTVKRTTTSVVVVEEKPNYIPYAIGGTVLILLIAGLALKGRSKPKPSKEKSGLERLFERYEDVEKIGEGGFATVYKAKRRDGKIVALKVPKSVDEETGKSFIREVSNWLHLRHPNIVRLYEANVVPVPYIEMEYCEGSLERERKPMDVDKAAWIIFNTAEGLKYAHSKKIIHRDLKPSNILLKNGIPKISDWGLSKFIGEEKAKTMVFTPYYASPEQIAPETFGDVDERSDIWQLGVIFYELVTGRMPFEGNSLSSLAQAITTREPVKPSEINPGVKEVEPIIMRMLAKRKEERYRSAEELQRDLAKVLGIKYQEALEKSVSAKDFSKSAFYAGELALMHLKLGNYKDALKYLRDLKVYSRSKELDGLISQVELAMDEGIKLGEDFLNRAEIVIHEAKMGR